MNTVESYNILHEEDDRIISGEFDFRESFFHLKEKDIPKLNNNFQTPIEKINKDFEGYENYLRFGHLNASSVPKHRDEISCVATACKFHVFGVCEHFIKDNTPSSVFNMDNYKLFHRNRNNASKGGVGIYVDLNIQAKRITLPNEPNQPEIIFVEITIGKIKIAVGEIYKSPLIPYGTYSQLYEPLAFITSRYVHVVILGDFNIDHLKENTPALNFFNLNVVKPFGLTQVVDEPTRITKDTTTLIDLVLTLTAENVKAKGVVDLPGISDHSLVYFTYAVKKPKFKPKMITKRDFS